jgi:hypothetical protein
VYVDRRREKGEGGRRGQETREGGYRLEEEEGEGRWDNEGEGRQEGRREKWEKGEGRKKQEGEKIRGKQTG